jgi:hypothetical protein
MSGFKKGQARGLCSENGVELSLSPDSSYASGARLAVVVFYLIDVSDKAITAPKLEALAGKHALGLLDCLGIVGANQRLDADEVSILTECVSPVVRHGVQSLPPNCIRDTAAAGRRFTLAQRNLNSAARV